MRTFSIFTTAYTIEWSVLQKWVVHSVGFVSGSRNSVSHSKQLNRTTSEEQHHGNLDAGGIGAPSDSVH